MSLRFTEEMKGFYTQDAPAYDTGYVTGQRDWNHLKFHLTIETDDVAAVLEDPRHRMLAQGYVHCPAFSAANLPIEQGTFELFAASTIPGRRLMRYRLPFASSLGPMTLLGYKDVGNDNGIDAWVDTTTLFTRLVRGIVYDYLDPTDEEYARGILRLNARMFARQLTTFRGAPLDIARFGAFFIKQLASVYGRRPQIEVRP